MGCAESQQIFSSENQETITIENNLPFRSCAPSYVEGIFKKFSKNKQITQNGFAKICQAFSIDDQSDLFSQFLDDQTGTYDACGLLAFALLVNRDASNVKIEIFWDLWDTNCDGYLDFNDLDSMLSTLIQASLAMLRMKQFNEHTLGTYLLKLEPKISTMQADLLSDLFGKRGQLSRVEFLNRMSRERNFMQLLDTGGIRKKLEDTSACDGTWTNKTSTD